VEISISHQTDVTVVAVVGNLEAHSAPELSSRLDGLLAGGDQRFVIDLAGVRFMDSSGIAVLIRLFKRVRIGHGDVRLAGAQPAVEKIIRLVRLDRVFDVFDDCALAVASFSAPATP
jgi:anti-sigma B factor antagonist